MLKGSGPSCYESVVLRAQINFSNRFCQENMLECGLFRDFFSLFLLKFVFFWEILVFFFVIYHLFRVICLIFYHKICNLSILQLYSPPTNVPHIKKNSAKKFFHKFTLQLPGRLSMQRSSFDNGAVDRLGRGTILTSRRKHRLLHTLCTATGVQGTGAIRPRLYCTIPSHTRLRRSRPGAFRAHNYLIKTFTERQ